MSDSSNCTTPRTDREQTLLLQQAALYSHVGLMVVALAFFHLIAWRQLKRGRLVNRRNPTVLALRLGRELLENTLMWAALLNISVIAQADIGVYILMCLIPVAVICVHVLAVLHFRRKITIIDERIESYDLALCFHFNTFFASKSWITRFVVIASVPVFTVIALVTGLVSGRITDLSITISECTASFLLAFFSSLLLIKPATMYTGWEYVVYQRALLRRTYAEQALADLPDKDRYRCPQALAPVGSSICDHLRYLATFKSTLSFSAREVVYRESTHLAFADHRNEKELSADMLATLTKTSVDAITDKIKSRHPQKRAVGPGWGTMARLAPDVADAVPPVEGGGAMPAPVEGAEPDATAKVDASTPSAKQGLAASHKNSNGSDSDLLKA